VILAGGAFGLIMLKPEGTGETQAAYQTRVSPRTALVMLVLFLGLLAALPLLAAGGDNLYLRIADTFYRVGALVFGGGHVVLPLLEAEIVPPGLVDRDTFLAGYGMAQAIPGPLFTFSAYLGAAAAPDGSEIAVAATALIAMFGSTFLLVPAALPFWAKLRANSRAQATLGGVNAAVVGLILAALYDPVFISAVVKPIDFALVALAYLALAIWKLPPWLVVLLGAAVGWGTQAAGL
jgi:chromate transporter